MAETKTKKATTTTAKVSGNPELELFEKMAEHARAKVKEALGNADDEESTIQHHTNRALKQVIGASKWA